MQTRIKNILVLTDLSENSVNAYRYAVQLACQIKADILLVFSTNGEPISLTSQMNYSQMLHSFAKRYACTSRAGADLLHTECLISGKKWTEAIPLLTEVHQPELVVAGSGLLNQFEEAQANLAMHHLKQSPIIWVPGKASYRPLQDLAYVTDFTDQDDAVTEQVKALAQQFGARLSLIHFYPKTGRANLAAIKKQGTGLQKLLGETATGIYLIEEEDMIEGLEDFAGKHPVDLFLLATRDTHLAHHYFQPVYCKTNSCQTAIPLMNYYQEKKKACAGSCVFCHEHKTLEMASA